MKSKLLAVGLLIMSVAFADNPRVLLIGDARAVVQQGPTADLHIRAQSISLIGDAKQLHCSGAVEIRSGTTVVRTGDCVVDLGTGTQVFHLNPNGVEITPRVTSKAMSAAGKPEAGSAERRVVPKPSESHE